MMPAAPARVRRPAIASPSPPPRTWLAYAIGTIGTSGRSAAIRPIRRSEPSSEAPARSAAVVARCSVAPSASGSL